MSEMTLDEIAYLARRDYDALAGQTVSVTSVDAIFGSADGRMTVVLDPPALVRIVPYDTLRRVVQDVETRWVDGELAPIYAAEVCEPHSSLVDVDMMWVHGTRYDLQGGATPGGIATPTQQFETPVAQATEVETAPAIAVPPAPEVVIQNPEPQPEREAPEASKVNTSSPWYRPG